MNNKCFHTSLLPQECCTKQIAVSCQFDKQPFGRWKNKLYLIDCLYYDQTCQSTMINLVSSQINFVCITKYKWNPFSSFHVCNKICVTFLWVNLDHVSGKLLMSLWRRLIMWVVTKILCVSWQVWSTKIKVVEIMCCVTGEQWPIFPIFPACKSKNLCARRWRWDYRL